MSGLHATMLVGGAVCVVGAGLGLLMRPSSGAIPVVENAISA